MNCFMPEVVEIPIELTQFQLPQAVQERLQLLLDRQMKGRNFAIRTPGSRRLGRTSRIFIVAAAPV